MDANNEKAIVPGDSGGVYKNGYLIGNVVSNTISKTHRTIFMKNHVYAQYIRYMNEQSAKMLYILVNLNETCFVVRFCFVQQSTCIEKIKFFKYTLLVLSYVDLSLLQSSSSFITLSFN
jgi:FlaA1/EpsC-like NDP-sugar epimerase